MKRNILCMCMLLITGLLSAADIYVKSGESLTHALRQARELRRLGDPSVKNGVTIHLEPGNYFLYESLFVRPEDSGTPESPTLITSDGGAVLHSACSAASLSRRIWACSETGSSACGTNFAIH